jgi:hypothetical protein
MSPSPRRDSRPGCPSRAQLGSRHRPTQPHLTRRPRVTFAAPPWITSLPPAKGYNPDSESLPNRAHQERHEVHVHTLQPQREHARFRRQGWQPPHSGRDRNQHSRHQRTPRAHDRFPRRRSAAQLALAKLQRNSGSLRSLRSTRRTGSRRESPLCLIVGGAAVYRCDKLLILSAGFSRWGCDSRSENDSCLPHHSDR